jgi:hypothetical protein
MFIGPLDPNDEIPVDTVNFPLPLPDDVPDDNKTEPLLDSTRTLSSGPDGLSIFDRTS